MSHVWLHREAYANTSVLISLHPAQLSSPLGEATGCTSQRCDPYGPEQSWPGDAPSGVLPCPNPSQGRCSSHI